MFLVESQEICYFCTRYFISQGLGCTYQALGCTYQSLGYTYQSLKYKMYGVEKTVNLQSDKELIKRIRKETMLERGMSGVNKLAPESFSHDERLRRALKFIDKHGFITLSDYARINKLSRSGASRELRALSGNPDSGIVSNGTAPHKT